MIDCLLLFSVKEKNSMEKSYSICWKKKFQWKCDIFCRCQTTFRIKFKSIHFGYSFNPVVTVQNQPPPPPYQQPSRTYSMNAANALQAYAVSQQQPQCPIHQRQPCSCTQNSTEVCLSNRLNESEYVFSHRNHHHQHRHWIKAVKLFHFVDIPFNWKWLKSNKWKSSTHQRRKMLIYSQNYILFMSHSLSFFFVWRVQQHVTPPSCISPSYPNNELSQNFKAAINSIKVPSVNSTPNLVKSNTNKGMSYILRISILGCLSLCVCALYPCRWIIILISMERMNKRLGKKMRRRSDCCQFFGILADFSCARISPIYIIPNEFTLDSFRIPNYYKANINQCWASAHNTQKM